MSLPKIILLLFLAFFFCSTTSLQAKSWRGIVPLKSTRADVEKLLGKPNELGRYQFENERVYIDYSVGCTELDECICLVPKDTVIDINVNLEINLKFSNLKIDKRKYKKTESTHLPGVVTYANQEIGVIYAVDEGRGMVTNITYVASARDCSQLMKLRGRGSSETLPNLEKPTTLILSNCEANAAALDAARQMAGDDGLIVAIARLGDGERNRNLSRRRLLMVTRYLTKAPWSRLTETVVVAEGERVKGYGRVELYVSGKRFHVLPIGRNRNLLVHSCGGL